MAQDHTLAQKMAGKEASSPGLTGQLDAATATQEDQETPRGTLFILLLFGASIVLLWGYMYLTMIFRR